MKMTQENHYNDLLDKLQDSYESQISNYALDEWENLHDEDGQIMHRGLLFSRGDKDYFVVVNPAGQIKTMHPDTPLDLVVQIGNCSICLLYEEMQRS